MDGFINLNKPAGITSHDAVNKVRKIFQTKKVGHAGTLDPAACGVLLVAIGRATKFIEYFADCDKTYRAEILFGTSTDSGDLEGKIIRQSENFTMPNLAELQNATKNFLGEIEQTPPKFSAIKINGRKAYDLVRKDIDFEMPKRKVFINRFEILSVDKNVLTAVIDCTKGTYIRSLAVDFGLNLNLPATLKNLQRTRVGNFNLTNAVDLENLQIAPENFLQSIETCLEFEKFILPPHRIKAFCSGLSTTVNLPDKLVKVYFEEKFLGVGKILAGELKSEKLALIK